MKRLQMIFQVVSDDGVIYQEHKYRMPLEPCKHMAGRIVASIGEREAGRFWEDAVHKGVLSESLSREPFNVADRRDL